MSLGRSGRDGRVTWMQRRFLSSGLQPMDEHSFLYFSLPRKSLFLASGPSDDDTCTHLSAWTQQQEPQEVDTFLAVGMDRNLKFAASHVSTLPGPPPR